MGPIHWISGASVAANQADEDTGEAEAPDTCALSSLFLEDYREGGKAEIQGAVNR